MDTQGRPRGAMVFRKSSFSENVGSCVEIAFVDGGVVVRDSKDPNGPVLFYTDDEWGAFVSGVQAGELSLTGQFGLS